MSQHYPIHLNLSGRLCVVVGGGGVGERRAVGLLSAEAVVRVVTQEASEILQRLANENRLELRLKPYEPTDLESAFLVVAATDSREVKQLLGSS